MRVCKCQGRPANDSGVVYVGRAFAGWPASPVANPFRIGPDGTRPEVIGKFRMWLWGRIAAADAKVLGFLRDLPDDAVLGCWCAELADAERAGDEVCHAQVVAKASRWVKVQGV